MHQFIDNTAGTYLTDYLIFLVSILSCTWLLRYISIHNKEARAIATQCSKWLPWNWPERKYNPVTLMTYMVLVFSSSLAITSLLAGILHQILIDPEQYRQGWVYYVLTWKIGHAFLVPSFFALLCMSDQVIALETPLKLPKSIRVIYYATSSIASVVLLIHTFLSMHFSPDNPFEETVLFISFFIGFGIYCLSITSVLIYKAVCTIELPQLSYANSYSWHQLLASKDVTIDLILHTVAPWGFLTGALLQFFSAPFCSPSVVEIFNRKLCPFPDEFNHNCVFHMITAVAVLLIIYAEKMSIQRRKLSLDSLQTQFKLS